MYSGFLLDLADVCPHDLKVIDMLKKMGIPLSFDLLFQSCEIDLKTVKHFEDVVDFKLLSLNPFINVDIIQEYYTRLNLDNLIANKKITTELLDVYVQNVIDDYAKLDTENSQIRYINLYIKWTSIVSKMNISLDFYNKYKVFPWDYAALVTNPALSVELLDVIIDELDANCFKLLSINPVVDKSVLEKYSDKPFDFKEYSKNPSLTFDTVLKFMNNPWDLVFISQNKASDYKIIKFFYENQDNKKLSFANEPYNKIDWYKVSVNKGLTLYDIYKLQGYPLNMNEVYDTHKKELTLEKVLNIYEENLGYWEKKL